jgi:hypothetical protein
VAVNVTLGEFLDLAGRHAVAAEDAPVERPGDLIGGVLPELRQLVAIMTSYLDDAVRAGGLTPGMPSQAWEHSVLQQRHYLQEASRLLPMSWPGTPPPIRPRPKAPEGNAQAQGLAGITDALTAGRELMLSHYEPASWGGLAARSRWAPPLASEPVILAISGEMGQWSQVAASWIRWVAAHSPWHNAAAREALDHAATMLQAAAVVPERAGRPAGAAFREELLRAIPHHAPPQRLPPNDSEGHAELCAGIISSAERLRAAAFAPAWPGNLGSGPAWRRSSQACAIALDLASRAMPILAGHAALANVPLSAALEPGGAPAALASARDAWLAVAGCWQVITTDAQDPASPFTDDASDLTVRMSQLVTGTPQWSPAWQHQAPRDAARLAPDPQGLRLALASIHHAADAIECVARADLRGVQSAARAGRLYMPSRMIGGLALEKRPYLPAPADRAYLLQCACQAAIDTTAHATRMLDDLALRYGSPSRPVALIRKVTAGIPNRTLQAPPGILAAALRQLDRAPQSQRGRAEVDHQAIITAYAENGMTIQQISWLWPIPMRKVANILHENGIPMRNDRERDGRTTTPSGRPDASRQRRTTAQQPDDRTGAGRRRSDAGMRQQPPAQPTAARPIQPPHSAPPAAGRQPGITPRT